LVTSITYKEYAEFISKSPNDQALMTDSGKAQIVSLHGRSPVLSGLEMLTFQAAPTVDEPSRTIRGQHKCKRKGIVVRLTLSHPIGSNLLFLVY
jgi:hypothetical protein